MDIHSHYIETVRRARYFMIGAPGPHVKDLWIVLHGYGQLASYFLRHFEGLEAPDRLIVAPEGLSRFYLDGNFGRVGASWMTKEDRLSEIDDHVAFLDTLHELLLEQCGGRPARLRVLGFSQGTATAWRWIRKGVVRPDHLILWAGSVPEERDAEMAKRLEAMRIDYVLGKQDPYFKAIQRESLFANVRKWIPGVHLHEFEGEHTMHPSLLGQLAE